VFGAVVIEHALIEPRREEESKDRSVSNHLKVIGSWCRILVDSAVSFSKGL
jgi:hypothetical protein